MRRSDAAIVGRLVRVVPLGTMRADYRYRVRRVYRGATMLGRGDTISVRSARGAAACGLPRRPDRPIGLFLLRDPRGHWTAGLCSTIAPRRLRRAAERGAGGSRRRPARASCTS
jgi:hypothetical protein